MAEIIQIEIKFNPKNRLHPFGLPNRIEVKKGTIIEWVIKDSYVLEEILFSKKKFQRGIKFTIYFDRSSAFEWKSESLLLGGFPSIFHQWFPIQIASGIAEKEGDHKYGLRLIATDNSEKSKPDYDDDPYITVY